MKTNKPSSTARLIARSLICLSFEHPDLVSKKFINLIEACSDNFGRLKDPILYLLKFRFSRNIISYLINRIIPGLMYHYAIRKREIRNLCGHCIRSNGIEQVVIFGAGFDSLSFDLRDEFKYIQIHEYDHSATQKVRVKAILETNWNMDRIEFFPIHLQGDTFILNNVTRFKKTLVIAEGLLMYLSDTEVRNFFQNLKNAFDQSFHIVFTFIESSKSGKPNFYNESPIVEAYLRWKNEPFHWGIKSASIDGFLKENDMDLKELVIPSAFMNEYFSSYSADHEIRERIAYATSSQ